MDTCRETSTVGECCHTLIYSKFSTSCHIGSNRPTIRLLNKLVKTSVTIKWYDLGIELLGDENLQALDEIQSNYPRDVSSCCTKMFQLWLDRQPEASWRQLVQALREPNIELLELANTLEQKLMSINEGSYHSLCVPAAKLKKDFWLFDG